MGMIGQELEPLSHKPWRMSKLALKSDGANLETTTMTMTTLSRKTSCSTLSGLVFPSKKKRERLRAESIMTSMTLQARRGATLPRLQLGPLEPRPAHAARPNLNAAV